LQRQRTVEEDFFCAVSVRIAQRTPNRRGRLGLRAQRAIGDEQRTVVFLVVDGFCVAVAGFLVDETGLDDEDDELGLAVAYVVYVWWSARAGEALRTSLE